VLALLVYTLLLLVVMPLLLLWVGKFALYGARRKPRPVGFPPAVPVKPADGV